VTTPEPGTSDAHDSEPAKPDLRKNTDPEPPTGDSPDTHTSETDHPDTPKPGPSDTTPDFGRTFDYDATAQASLSAQPPTSESLGGSHGTPGPGWDTYSGVGNGPGWGSTPSYPPPSENPQSDYPPPGAYSYGEQQTPPQQGATPPQYGNSGYSTSGPVYGSPDPQYPTGNPSGYAAQEQPYGGYPAPPGYGPAPGMPAPYGYYDPAAPFGREPYTGEPYSDKSKVTAGLLEILLGPFGAGRFYLDQPGIAIAQIAVTWLTCGIGGIWPLIDGIMMLTDKVRDKHGRPLHP
jgi:hypothetical protein